MQVVFVKIEFVVDKKRGVCYACELGFMARAKLRNECAVSSME